MPEKKKRVGPVAKKAKKMNGVVKVQHASGDQVPKRIGARAKKPSVKLVDFVATGGYAIVGGAATKFVAKVKETGG